MISGFKKHPNLHKMNKKFINSFITNITDHLYHVGDPLLLVMVNILKGRWSISYGNKSNQGTARGGEASYLIHTDIYLIFVVFTV